MNLQETKQHILDACNNQPEVMQKAALAVIDEKIKEEFINSWVSNNKDELIKVIELIQFYGGAFRVKDFVNIIKKHGISIANKKRIGKDYQEQLNKLLIKIDKL